MHFYRIYYFFFFFFFFQAEDGIRDLTVTGVQTCALPIFPGLDDEQARIIAATLDAEGGPVRLINGYFVNGQAPGTRSEEHTSELQSQSNLVCRLLLEKKKKKRREH